MLKGYGGMHAVYSNEVRGRKHFWREKQFFNFDGAHYLLRKVIEALKRGSGSREREELDVEHPQTPETRDAMSFRTDQRGIWFLMIPPFQFLGHASNPPIWHLWQKGKYSAAPAGRCQR